MPLFSTVRADRWLPMALIPALAIIAYLPVLWNGFIPVWDDGLLILDNPIVATGLSFKNILAAFTRYDPELYIPLTFLSYQYDVTIAGLHPMVFHLTNLLLHIANAYLVWWVVELLTGQRTAGIIIALLFALHPLNVETVAWVSARKDVLSSFFFLLTVGAYLMHARYPHRRWRILSIVAFALGLLSKVSIVVTPVLLVLIDWYENREVSLRSIAAKWPYVALSAVAATIAAYGKAAAGWFLFEKTLIAFRAIAFYLEKILVPVGLSTVYPYTDPISLFTPDIFFSIVVVVAITVLVVRQRSLRVLPLAWGWFLLLLLPSFATIAKGTNQTFDVYFASDRYVYLAAVGAFLLLGLCAAELIRTWRGVGVSIVALVLTLFGFASFRQSFVWYDTQRLFQHALASYPHAHVAHTNVGVALYEAGDKDGAVREFQAAVAIRPDATAYSNLAAIAYERGQIAQAEDYYHRAQEANPGDIDAFINEAALLIEDGFDAKAIPLLSQALTIDPTNRLALINMGLALEGTGDLRGALASYEKALALFPEDHEIQATVDDVRHRIAVHNAQDRP